MSSFVTTHRRGLAAPVPLAAPIALALLGMAAPAGAEERAPRMGDIVFDVAIESVAPTSIFHGSLYNHTRRCNPDDPDDRRECAVDWDEDFVHLAVAGKDGAGRVFYQANATGEDGPFARVGLGVGPVYPANPAAYEVRDIVVANSGSERLDLAFAIDSRNASAVRQAFAPLRTEHDTLLRSQALAGGAPTSLDGASGTQPSFLPPAPHFRDPSGSRPLWKQAQEGIYMTDPVVPIHRTICDGYVAAGRAYVTGDALWRNTNPNGEWRVTLRYTSLPITCTPTPETARYPERYTEMASTDVTFVFRRREIPYPTFPETPACTRPTLSPKRGSHPGYWPGSWTIRGGRPDDSAVRVDIHPPGWPSTSPTPFDVEAVEPRRLVCPEVRTTAQAVPISTTLAIPAYEGDKTYLGCVDVVRPRPFPFPLAPRASGALRLPEARGSSEITRVPRIGGPIREIPDTVIRFLQADTLVVSPRVQVMAYEDRCENGVPGRMRLRYVRTREDGTVDTDVLLDRYVAPPR